MKKNFIKTKHFCTPRRKTIILITGYGQSLDTTEIQNIGIRELLEKPIEPGQLGQKIRRTLDSLT